MKAKQGDRPVTYLAYLVRLWRDDETSPWRARVEEPHTGDRQAFPDLQSLFAFLEEETGTGREAAAGNIRPGGDER